MTDKEQSIVAKERKQTRATLEAIRTENNAIGKCLARVIGIVGSIRASQLGIDLTISEFEKKLG